jgi:hypothetical protein
MIVRTVIEIPGEATLRDVRSIIETLTGLGYVRETDLSEQTMTFEFTADDAAQLTPIQLAIVDAAVRLVDGITSDAAVRAAVAAVSLSDRWARKAGLSPPSSRSGRRRSPYDDPPVAVPSQGAEVAGRHARGADEERPSCRPERL